MNEKPTWLKSASKVVQERAGSADIPRAANASLEFFLPKDAVPADVLEKVDALEQLIKDVEIKKPEVLREGVRTENDELAEAAIGTWTLEEMCNYLRHADVWENPPFTRALIDFARVRIDDVRRVYL